MTHRITRDFEILDLKESLKSRILQTFYNWDSLFYNPNIQVVEHTSANPTGKPHLGNLTNGIVGDTICRLTGAKPYFYVNDAGRNFFTFVEKSKIRGTIPLELCYGEPLEINPERLDLSLQNYLKQGLTSQQISLRNSMLDNIEKVLGEYGVDTSFTYLYESHFRERILEHRQNNTSLKRLYRSNGTPLYIVGDLFYRKQMYQKFSNNWAIVLGNDQTKHESTLRELIAEEFNLEVKPLVYYVPTVKKEGKKLSKRFKIGSSDVNPKVFRLHVLKNILSPMIDLDSYSDRDIEFLKILKVQKVRSTQVEQLLLRMSEDQLSPLHFWANFKQILSHVVQPSKIHRLYKFLQHITFKARNFSLEQKQINSYFKSLLLDRLNL